MSKVKYLILPFLVFFLPLVLYVKTLSPTYIPVDSAEFSLCMKFLGICHPPGFPLYTLIGKVFTIIWPFGTLIYKANLLSAIFGAGTILLVYLSLVSLKVKKQIVFLLSIFLAVSSVFWEFSIAADVFTFAAFLIALTFFLVFKNKPWLAFFALGLSASHFYISVIIFPLLVWYFYSLSFSKVKEIILAGIIFALGFTPQIFLYLRMQTDPEINWGHAQGFLGFVDFVRRREFGSIFLLSNPALKFSLAKLFKHFYLYFETLTVDFGVIFAPLALLAFVFGGLFKNRQVLLLMFSFVAIFVIQLILLSTIDPTGTDNPFQISKFYLSSFVPAVLLMGVGVNFLSEKFFGNDTIYASILLIFFVGVYLVSNFKTYDFSKNYFSQNLVLDAMEQLPENSVAITVSHIVYFGALYEQKINGKFTDVKLLYFPNEKNRDGEKYHPELFSRSADQTFVDRVKKDKILGNSENYVLLTIARNLDRPIYILQGTFEEGFFTYLKPYIKPWGLWWRVGADQYTSIDPVTGQKVLMNLRNDQVKFDQLLQKNQQLDLLAYAVAYHSTAVALAANNHYDEALNFFQKSDAVRSKGDNNIQTEIELVTKTKNLESQLEKLISEKDKLKLAELGNDYYTLGNFRSCIDVFSKIVNIDPQDAQSFNNLASCLAASGEKAEARKNYQKALQLDPNLDFAKKGLEALGND